MTTKDYIFRIMAVAVIWTALAIPSVTAGLFVITDVFDLAIAILVLGAGSLMTLGIWCGPELVRCFTGTTESRNREQQLGQVPSEAADSDEPSS